MSLIVEVNQGKLEGTTNTSVLTKKTYYSFQGIPYAKPPLGKLRFQAPQPYGKWDGIYDAKYERESCVQIGFPVPTAPFGSEDCLYLNVNTPQNPNDTEIPKPVMVFIHGGGFFSGTGSEKTYSSDYLIEQDIIVVTLNYRLHVLGFLNLGIPQCPGNVGLKDQLLALNWVKENIDKFGGDPENITIVGESAGASSVHYHTISPLSKSKGLFQKAIMQSGSVYSPWALTYDPIKMAFEFGKILGFENLDKEKLLELLLQQDASYLAEKVMEFMKELMIRYPGKCSIIPFPPSVEEIQEGAFLPKMPVELLKDGDQLPIIYGANDRDGMIAFATDLENCLEMMRQDFTIILKYNFKITGPLPDLAKKVKDHYFGDDEISFETADEVINLFTDLYYYRFYEAIENITSSSSPAYIYEFAYDGSFNFWKQVIESVNPIHVKGACHGDELGYLLYPKMLTPVPPIEGNDRKIISYLTTLWANFAKSGEPTTSDEVKWNPSTQTEPSYLHIDTRSDVIKGTIYGGRLQFLKNLLGSVAIPYNYI